MIQTVFCRKGGFVQLEILLEMARLSFNTWMKHIHFWRRLPAPVYQQVLSVRPAVPVTSLLLIVYFR